MWRRSKHEVWISLAIALLGFFTLPLGAPTRPSVTIGLPIVLLLAWLFAVDAVLNWHQTHPIALTLINFWCFLLTCILPIVLWSSFTTRHWANR